MSQFSNVALQATPAQAQWIADHERMHQMYSKMCQPRNRQVIQSVDTPTSMSAEDRAIYMDIVKHLTAIGLLQNRAYMAKTIKAARKEKKRVRREKLVLQ